MMSSRAFAGAATPLTGWEASIFSPSPSGERIVFWKERADSKYDWYVVGRGGAAPRDPVRMHEALTGEDNTGSFVIWSSDSNAAYFQLRRSSGDDEIIRVRFDESGLVSTQTVDGPHPSGGSVRRTADITAISSWSPDGWHIVYSADSEELEVFNTYVVNVKSADPKPFLLHDANSVEHRVRGMVDFSPTGEALVVRANFEHTEKGSIRAVLLTGSLPGPRIPIVTNVSASEAINATEWSPDGRWLALSVYDSDQEIGRVLLLPFDGSAFGSVIEVADPAPGTLFAHFLGAGF